MILAQVLYNLTVTILAIPALPIAGLALLVRPRYRLGLRQRLGVLSPAVRSLVKNQQPLWVHAPSVGEILATQPFLQELKQQFPKIPILLSTLTPTAYTTAREKIPEADAIIYFPLDHPLIVNHVLRHIRPMAFFFSETEMWPNFLLAAAQRHIPTFLISGRFSPRALVRYRLLSAVFRPVFQTLTRCCMQTDDDKKRLLAAGAVEAQVVVTGNFKLDVVRGEEQPREFVLQETGLANRPLLIGASTHSGEEEFLLRMCQRLRVEVPALLLLLAPRHPQRFPEVERLLRQQNCRYVTRSEHEPASRDTEVFLLDTLGELASFYHAAVATFVGGSLIKGPGGHSVIEPALARTPVCFGPYTANFSTIVEQLQQVGGGFIIHTEEEGYQKLLPLFTDARQAQAVGQRAYKVVQQGQGAVRRTMAIVLEVLSNRQAGSLLPSSRPHL